MNLLKIFLILALLLNSSCTTRCLWKSRPSQQDTIKNFLVSTDGSKVVFIGDRYHYIFDDTAETIQKIVKWEGVSKLKITLGRFKIHSTDQVKVSGHISTLDENISDADVDFLKSAGFSKEASDKNIYGRKIAMNGTIYLPSADEMIAEYQAQNDPSFTGKKSQPLTQRFAVILDVEKSWFSWIKQTSKKIALTPIKLTQDAPGFIAGAAVTAIATIFFAPISISNAVIKTDPREIILVTVPLIAFVYVTGTMGTEACH